MTVQDYVRFLLVVILTLFTIMSTLGVSVVFYVLFYEFIKPTWRKHHGKS